MVSWKIYGTNPVLLNHPICLIFTKFIQCLEFFAQTVFSRSKTCIWWRTKTLNVIEKCLKLLWVRTQMVMVGWVLHCECAVETERCQQEHSGSSPAAYRHGKPPPPDELLRHGSPLPAVADSPPAKLLWTLHWAKSQLVHPHLWLSWLWELQTAGRILRLGLLVDPC